jgi:hypothetical protein
MSPERTAAALVALAERGHRRGPGPVLAAARRDSEAVLLPVAAGQRPRARGRRVLQGALVAVVAISVALTLVAVGVLPGRDTLDRATHAILGERSPFEEQLDAWLAGYDPAERQHLKDMTPDDFGFVSKQYEVGTLEFRRTCRKLAAAIDAAEAPGVVDRSAIVWGIMGPQLDRYDERDRVGARADGQEPITGQPGSMSYAWRQLTDQLASGDALPAGRFIDSNCGDSFGPWIDE